MEKNGVYFIIMTGNDQYFEELASHDVIICREGWR